jgi:predicted nucleic acid-binding protein
MNVVDSCAWLEYFADGPNTVFFSPAIEDVAGLLVPTITLYEVFKRVRQQRSEEYALQAVAMMMQGRVVPLDTELALDAADVSLQHALPMADSVILATAQAHGATVWTQDAHFVNLPGVRYEIGRAHV